MVLDCFTECVAVLSFAEGTWKGTQPFHLVHFVCYHCACRFLYNTSLILPFRLLGTSCSCTLIAPFPCVTQPKEAHLFVIVSDILQNKMETSRAKQSSRGRGHLPDFTCSICLPLLMHRLSVCFVCLLARG